jgi:KUP system potassium uptake protein
MVVWFVAIALAGLLHIRDDPGVLAAINPGHAVAFLYAHGHIGLVTLGAVFLVVTGGEALYADLGHFGRKPIQTAWFSLVLPALLLNYFGQGAKGLADPAIENRSTGWCPSRCCCRWSCSRRRPLSSRCGRDHWRLFAGASGHPP